MNRAIVTGIGVVLPGKEEPCVIKERFYEIVKNGECHISQLERMEKYGVKLAGQVKNLDISYFNLPEKYLNKYSRAALLGAVAVKNAIKDANLTSEDLSNERTGLFVASSIFAQENVSKMYEKLYRQGSSTIHFDFMLQGTPASVPCAISKLVELDCPMYSIAGSCVSGPHAIQMAYEKLQLNQIDRAVVVGVDATIDPIYLLSISYKMKNGQTISNMSDNPKAIRPHDGSTAGNACGEGAVAIILERNEDGKVCAYKTSPFKLHYCNSRKNGISLFDAGEPDNIARTVKTVLDMGKISINELGFINSFCEGTHFIEDFFNDTIKHIRNVCQYDGEILLSNQEAAFGHIGGVTGLIKFLSNIMSMTDNKVFPTINCQIVNGDLDATPVINKSVKKMSKYSMIINNGAGGDCSVMLIEKN